MKTDRRAWVLLASTLASTLTGGCARPGGEPIAAPEGPAPALEDPATAPEDPATAPEDPATDPEARLEALRRDYEAAGGSAARLAVVESELDEFLARYPDHPEALVLLAQVHLEQGEPDPSLSVAERCVAVEPRSADCWLTIGVLSETRKAKARAAEAYGRYLALRPDGRYADDVRRALTRLGVEPPAAAGDPAPAGEGPPRRARRTSSRIPSSRRPSSGGQPAAQGEHPTADEGAPRLLRRRAAHPARSRGQDDPHHRGLG